MATDTFLKVDGIKGESTDVHHKDEIELLSWTWGVAQAPDSSAAGGGSGKPKVSELFISKKVDKASPNLFRSCLTGKHIKDVELAQRRTGAGNNNFLVIKLKKVRVTGMNLSTAGGDASPTENISISFDKVSYEYIPLKPTGQPDTPVVLKWDVKANKEF